jgi:hypothetical protein
VAGRVVWLEKTRAFPRESGPQRPVEEAVIDRLGEVIARSGREQARDALSGPLLQLMKRRVADTDTPSVVGDEIALEPIAEPALAALLALMVRDLLDDTTVRLLTDAFTDTIPLG